MSNHRIVPATPTSLLFTSAAYSGRSGPLLSWVAAFWLVGATAFSLRLLSGWILAEGLRYKMARPAPAEWQRTLDRLKGRLSLSAPVRLLVSGALQAPAAIGCLRPIVLVPAGALAGLPAEQMEALLVHELAHIRRHDYLVHILQSAVESLLFFHPAVWWVSGHMSAERELCCDDVAVSFTGDAVLYARALAEFGAIDWVDARSMQPAVMAANSGSVAGRIARLLGKASASDRMPGSPASAAALMLLAIGACALIAQTPGRPQFEAASVKPSVSQRVQYVRPLPGRLSADATIRTLAQYAFGVQPFQVVGGPDRVLSQRYAIDATAGAKVGRDRMFLMLQSLLEDRFQLKIHREMRDLPAYALLPAREGIKLSGGPPMKDAVCLEEPAEGSPQWTGSGRMATPGEADIKIVCANVDVAVGPSGLKMQGGKVAMPELVRALSMAFDRPVIDKTGYKGLFDLQLGFVADDRTPRMPPPPPGSGISGPSLPQALQDQLGLRLESTKSPVEVIVIDHAEAPSGN